MIAEDRAIGVIPTHISESGACVFCIVRHADGHWGFPKGHQEVGESEESTARRELAEETGITRVEIDTRPFTEEYSFERDGQQYHKSVTYFIGRVSSLDYETPEAFRAEIPEVRWLSYEEAKETLTFPEGKKLLDEVLEYVR